MKKIQIYMLITGLVLSTGAFAQEYDRTGSSWDFTIGAGVANYYGDLTQNNAMVFKQPSYAVTLGLLYNLSKHVSFHTDLSFSQVKASDSKNKRADLQARNLNFKSKLLDVDVAVIYNFLNIEKYKFSPYAFFGVGWLHFNPYTTDRNGAKQYLRNLGTEGQGLAAYPDREKYDRCIVQATLGGGIKYKLNNRMTIMGEFKYHYLDTDYLDDVSSNPYPTRSILAASNPALPNLTYRGDELPGGASYPTSPLARGNSKERDAVYTGELKLAIRFKRY